MAATSDAVRTTLRKALTPLGALGVLLVACAPRLSRPSAAPLAAGSPAAPSEDVTPAQVRATRLTAPPCVLLDVQDGRRAPLQRCPGLAGYQLLLERDAAPPNVSVLGVHGERWVLHLERVAQAPSSAIGESALWHVQGVRVALALSLVSPGGADARWAIAKVTPERACFIDTFPLTEGSVEAMESVLARAHRRPCLPP